MRLRRALSVPVLSVAAVLGASSIAWAAHGGHNKPLGDHLVGRQADGSVLTSANQYVTPVGAVVKQTGRPMDMLVRPDGKTAVDVGHIGFGPPLFTVIDLVNHKVRQQYTPPAGTGDGTLSVAGLLYSKDGNTVWAAQTRDILQFSVGADGTLSSPQVISIPAGSSVPKSPSGSPASPLPTDLQFTPDGTHVLVVLDGWNTLGVLDPATKTITSQIPVGVVPRDVVVIGNHAFVSNEGGRQPTTSDFTNYSYDSQVVAESKDGRANNGTISEVDLSTNKVVNTYTVGLDPSSMLVDGTTLLVTNSSDDTISIIDTAAGAVTQTVNVNPLPGQPFGSSPNALAFFDPTHLVVSLGRDNALAVYDYHGAHQ
ncbi:MAG: YncE family protein, partial [Mycobacteriales bacterium]